MIPERSIKAKLAKSVFYEDVNDIDIYIEDTAKGYVKLFVLLFSRVFTGKYKVSNVYPLGGRTSVIEMHSKHNRGSRPSLYVIDGDLFLLVGDNVSNKSGLYRFPFYCVENLLCDPESIVTIFDEEEAFAKKHEVHNDFNYLDWIDLNEDGLFDLFVEYSVSFILNPTAKTVSFSVNKLVSADDGCITPEKLSGRIKDLKKESIGISCENKYYETRGMIVNDFINSKFDKLDAVSGKDYIFPLLKMRAKAVVKTKVSDINLKLRLARICDVEKILEAKNYVFV